MLSVTSRITWSDEESRKLKVKELTTKEIIACCEDLKVLGKKDFRNLLKWRLSIRGELGLSTKPEEEEKPTETVTVTEDDQIDADMARMLAQDTAIKKRERRRLNERKQKEITRMQLGMLTPHELGMEHNAMDEDEIFGLKQTQKNGVGVLSEVLTGAVPNILEDDESDMGFHEYEENEDDVDNLESQLDNMYLLPPG
jgi:AdoMet-dependent rRNA methyltransferase SPB1